MNPSALFKSLVVSVFNLFRPRLLLMVILVPVIVLVGWIFLAWMFWGGLLSFTQGLVASASWMMTLMEWTSREWGLEISSFTFFLTLFWVVLVLFPLVLISTFVFISFFTVPVIFYYLEQEYPGLEKKHGFNSFGQIWRVFIWGITFVVLWSFSIPLWIVPPLGPTLSFILTVWFQKNILSLECLAEHASKEEYDLLIRQNRFDLWVLSFTLTSLLTIPIVNLIVPIYSCLVFSNFLFGRLNKLREAEGAALTP